MSVEDLFRWLMSRYGRRFTDMWSMVDPDDVKAAWRDELYDLGPDDIARGLAACREKDWPPSAPEFRNMCMPRIDYEAAYAEAATQWYARSFDRSDTWSNPAIYWAASAIGSDVMQHPYRWMANRWKSELDAAITAVKEGRLPSKVPPALFALPSAPETVATSDEVRKILGGAA